MMMIDDWWWLMIDDDDDDGDDGDDVYLFTLLFWNILLGSIKSAFVFSCFPWVLGVSPLSRTLAPAGRQVHQGDPRPEWLDTAIATSQRPHHDMIRS